MKLVESFIDDLTEDRITGSINSFADMMNEIAYAWDDKYKMRRDSDGIFVVHKLYIGKNWAQYKEHYFKVAPGVYEQVEKFYEIVKEEVSST